MEYKITKEHIKMIIIILIISIIIISLAFAYKYFIAREYIDDKGKYLIIAGSVIYEKTPIKWKQITKFDDKLSDLLYKITDGKKVIEDVTMQFLDETNEWYFYNKDYDFVTMKNYRYATHNLDVKGAEYKIETITDINEDKVIKKFLTHEKIKKIKDYAAGKITVDLDGDNQDETIYVLSNYSFENTSNNIKSFMIIHNTKGTEKISEINNTNIRIMEILDLDSDGKYEVIVGKGIEDQAEFTDCYTIYKYKNNKLKFYQGCN